LTDLTEQPTDCTARQRTTNAIPDRPLSKP
jgi:hypothetical protein